MRREEGALDLYLAEIIQEREETIDEIHYRRENRELRIEKRDSIIEKREERREEREDITETRE